MDEYTDEMASERTGHLPSHAEVKKIKTIAVHTHVCLSLRISLSDSSSSKNDGPPCGIVLHCIEL